MYFWRDSTGHEMDILVDTGDLPFPIEIKSGETITPDFMGGPDFWRKLAGSPTAPAALVYGGEVLICDPELRCIPGVICDPAD